jgi:hypothetical protein
MYLTPVWYLLILYSSANFAILCVYNNSFNLSNGVVAKIDNNWQIDKPKSLKLVYS